MKILVTGGSGLLGSRLSEMAVAEGHRVYSAYCHNPPEFGVPIKLDLADIKAVSRCIDELSLDAVIHAAAITDVDRCETDKGLAYSINSDGTRIVSEAADRAGAFLVYLSTDYVFEGTSGMYSEEDKPSPVNYYGYTKLEGERYCSGCVARTCVVYGSRPASGKINFALWIIERLEAGEEVKAVVDQYVTPTLNTNLAKMVLEAAEKRLCGTYHLAGATRVSRYEFACRLADIFGLDEDLIRPSSMSDMSWKAKRPADSSLDTSKAMRVLDEKPYDLVRSLKTLRSEMNGD